VIKQLPNLSKTRVKILRKNNKRPTLRKNPQIKIFTLFRALKNNRRAVSPVISNLILIAAVISAGIALMTFAQSASIRYQSEYAYEIGSDIGKLKESLTFEYATYASGQVKVYFINSGTIPITIESASIDGSPLTNFSIYHMSNDTESGNKIIAGGYEGYLISSFPLNSGTYLLKLKTGSETIFAYPLSVV
jgi:flagellin-like protein